MPPKSIAASTIKPIIKSKVIVLNHHNIDTIDEHFDDDDSNSIGNKSSLTINNSNNLNTISTNNTFNRIRANGMVVRTGIKTVVAQNAGSLATPRPTKDLKYSQLRFCDDYFENRFNKDTGKYYYFNPYTGETILDAESGYLDRSKSFWAQPDAFPSEKAKATTMYPVWYACRNGGPYRKRKGPYVYNNIEEAALRITTTAIGWLTRQNIRRIINQRYYKFIDISSKYFYFVDNKTKSTSWYKPRLAFPTDILKKEDMRDAGDNFRNYSKGPVIARVGLGKTKLSPYRKPITLRDDDDVPPPPEPELIDLEVPDHRLVSTWFDSSIPKLGDYYLLYELMLQNNWDTILDQYKKACAINHKLIKMFCLYAFQRMALEIENEKGFMSNTCVEVMDLMLQKFENEGHTLKYGCNEMQFAVLTLQHMLSQHAGRREFYSTTSVEDDEDIMESGVEGPVRSAKMEEYLQNKMDILVKYLRHIPVELIRDKKTLEDFESPTRRAVDFAAVLINCLAYLAHEPLERDLLAVHCAKYVFNAIKVCIHESAVVSVGFRCYYNFCYMCKDGQDTLLDLLDEFGADISDYINAARMNELHSDYEVQREARRLELSLQTDGWRGKVEEQITREMMEKREGYDLSLKKLE